MARNQSEVYPKLVKKRALRHRWNTDQVTSLHLIRVAPSLWRLSILTPSDLVPTRSLNCADVDEALDAYANFPTNFLYSQDGCIKDGWYEPDPRT